MSSRKGSWARARWRSNNAESAMSKSQRKKRKKRMAEYAAKIREQERPPRVKRNGKEITTR